MQERGWETKRKGAHPRGQTRAQAALHEGLRHKQGSFGKFLNSAFKQVCLNSHYEDHLVRKSLSSQGKIAFTQPQSRLTRPLRRGGRTRAPKQPHQLLPSSV